MNHICGPLLWQKLAYMMAWVHLNYFRAIIWKKSALRQMLFSVKLGLMSWFGCMFSAYSYVFAVDIHLSKSWIYTSVLTVFTDRKYSLVCQWDKTRQGEWCYIKLTEKKKSHNGKFQQLFNSDFFVVVVLNSLQNQWFIWEWWIIIPFC